MEIALVKQNNKTINIVVDGEKSHSFGFDAPVIKETTVGYPPAESISLGKQIYEFLFPEKSLTVMRLEEKPRRILLVIDDNRLQAIPWEYAYGPDGFLVRQVAFVRGIPKEKRRALHKLDRILHIVAIPSDPLDKQNPPLRIEKEWDSLTEIIDPLQTQTKLERVYPPTVDRLRKLVANEQNLVIHFMGHGGREAGRSFLIFEDLPGAPFPVSSEDLMLRLENSAFLITLNACISATPGETEFSNMTHYLSQAGVPYVMGMRYVIPDKKAVILSLVLYNELVSGTSVENAVRQARIKLADEEPEWLVGVPVLYTSLEEPAKGFPHQDGKPQIVDHLPQMEVDLALPKAEGSFQGRIDDLLRLGQLLTIDGRPPIITIHGGGGLGKTALAREAVDRFAHAFPGGVWAISFETLPSRTDFATRLAQFLGIPTQETADPQRFEQAVFSQLRHRRCLLVLDNAETLVEAVEEQKEKALDLVDLVKRLPSAKATLLVTSRYHLGFSGEEVLTLGGLEDVEGAQLFIQNAPQRKDAILQEAAERLSKLVGGHPLSLLLLGRAFNDTDIGPEAFIEEYEVQLKKAKDKYRRTDHRHHTLYASIQISVDHLPEEDARFLGKLSLFHAPFLREIAIDVFDPEGEYEEGQHSSILDQLHRLWQRGFLTTVARQLKEGGVFMYRLLPSLRLYAEDVLLDKDELPDLQVQFGKAYHQLVRVIYRGLDRSTVLVHIGQQSWDDLGRGWIYLGVQEQADYLMQLGKVISRLGNNQKALEYIQQAQEINQGQDQYLKLQLLNQMANVFHDTGQPGKALALYKEVLSIMRELGDQHGEAAMLNNIASAYHLTGQPEKALELFEEALPIRREVGDRDGEAATLNNMAEVYLATGQPGVAMKLCQEALKIVKEVRNRNGEGKTLNNMASGYQLTGQPEKALELYKESLTIARDLGDRKGEARTLNNMAEVYGVTGQPEKALELFEEALPNRREVGDRAGEAATLNNMAGVYFTTGRPWKALELFEEALPIIRGVGDRQGESRTLNNIANVYYATGQPGKAQELWEEALLISREVNDRQGEAVTLNHMARVYLAAGQSWKSLKLFEEALLIVREVGDRQGEAATLNNMASVYRATGQPENALTLYEESLPIIREVGDRAGEGTTLNNIAGVYDAIGQPEKALELYDKALPIIREVGDRAGEARTLNNIAIVYGATGQPEKALELYEEVLSIMREVGDRDGEAATLNNMALAYQATSRPVKALDLYEKSLQIVSAVGNHAGKAATLDNMASLLYIELGEPEDAIRRKQEAIRALEETDLRYDAGGNSIEEHEQELAQMQSGEPLVSTASSGHLSRQELEMIVSNTIAVMTDMPERTTEWVQTLQEGLEKAQAQKADKEIDFFSTLISILEGREANLPEEHPYVQALADIQQGITNFGPEEMARMEPILNAVQAYLHAEDWASTLEILEGNQELLFTREAEVMLVGFIEQARRTGKKRTAEMLEMHLALLHACREEGIDAAFSQMEQATEEKQSEQSQPTYTEEEFIARCVEGFKGEPEDKQKLYNYLQTLPSENDEHRKLILATQNALFGGGLSSLGKDLIDPYASVWKKIIETLNE